MTDLDAIRECTMTLFDAVPIEPKLDGLVVQHPFTDSIIKYNPHTKKMIDLSKPEDVNEFRNSIEKLVKSNDLSFIFAMINNPWLLTWFKMTNQFMDKKDFARYLKWSWVQEENPNQDVNVRRREAIKYFRDADKQYLMSSDERVFYNRLPETVTVYRGVSVGRERLGLSWTNDIGIAEWFKKRFDHGSQHGCILKARISKKHVLAYFNADLREEKELIVDVFAIKDKIEEIETGEHHGTEACT